MPNKIPYILCQRNKMAGLTSEESYSGAHSTQPFYIRLYNSENTLRMKEKKEL